MMSTLSISEIKKVYAALKREALTKYEQGDYVSAWRTMRDAVSVILEFNWEYSDPELEELLQKLSAHFLPQTPLTYNVDINRVVVLDDWCTSYVLVLQYIDALVAAGKEILYITSKDIDASSHKNIIPRISTYPKLIYHVIPTNSLPILDWYNRVYETIVDFQPSKVIAHIAATSYFLPIVSRLPEDLLVYRSNLDDQCFWLGTSAIDYSLEFRPFGVAVSRERRGLKPEQQLYVPFYPIKDGNPFEGFPELPEGSVTIFSGGDFYKTLDPDYTYWNLIKEVLHAHPQAVMLFATKNGLRSQQEFLENFVRDNHLEKQFYFIGFRPDISEVFAHADIFMGTCPVCGSLTSQLAAINHKPILQYYLPDTYDDETEQAVCYNAPGMQISFSKPDEFLAEAKRLINNADYRKQRGEEIYEATLKPEQFNQVFIDAITMNHAPCPTKYVDYEEVALRWCWPEYMGFDPHLSHHYSLLKAHKLHRKVCAVWLKYNYQRFIAQKLFSLQWYKNKFCKLCKQN